MLPPEHVGALVDVDDAAHVSPLADMVAGIGQVLPEVVEAWDEAHQPMQEAPDRFNRRVADFWREVASTSRPSASSSSEGRGSQCAPC